jgi:hypothetical protein
MKYVIVVIVAAPDTKQQHRTLIDLAESLIVGTECTGVGVDRFCERYVLATDPTIDVIIMLQCNGDLANNLQNELERTTTAYVHNYFGTPRTRNWLAWHGLGYSYVNHGCTHGMVLQVGDDISTKTFEPLLVPGPAPLD